MSSQAAHPTLLIPGPIEFEDAVLNAMSHPRSVYFNNLSGYSNLWRQKHSQSHVGAPFVKTFGETLKMLRELFITSDPTSQPLVVSGSGTLGWDFVAANLVEPDEEVLVLHTGSFNLPKNGKGI